MAFRVKLKSKDGVGVDARCDTILSTSKLVSAILCYCDGWRIEITPEEEE